VREGAPSRCVSNTPLQALTTLNRQDVRGSVPRHSRGEWPQSKKVSSFAISIWFSSACDPSPTPRELDALDRFCNPKTCIDDEERTSRMQWQRARRVLLNLDEDPWSSESSMIFSSVVRAPRLDKFHTPLTRTSSLLRLKRFNSERRLEQSVMRTCWKNNHPGGIS